MIFKDEVLARSIFWRFLDKRIAKAASKILPSEAKLNIYNCLVGMVMWAIVSGLLAAVVTGNIYSMEEFIEEITVIMIVILAGFGLLIACLLANTKAASSKS